MERVGKKCKKMQTKNGLHCCTSRLEMSTYQTTQVKHLLASNVLQRYNYFLISGYSQNGKW